MQIKVLNKAISVLELLATTRRGMRLSEVARGLSLNKTTALRILRSLESHRLARKNVEGTFVLGDRILWWETCYRKNFELLALVRPRLERLRDRTTETAAFSRLVNDQAVCLDQACSPHVTSTRYEIGMTAPLNAGASARVLLAYMDSEQREKFLQRAKFERLTPFTIASRQELEKELSRCKAQGYAISKGERFPNTTSVAAAILSAGGEVLGAISIVGPSDRLTYTRCRQIVPPLIEETSALRRDLSNAIGQSGEARPKFPR